MFIKGKNNRVQPGSISVAGCLVLAIACCVLAISGTAMAKKPEKPGGGKTSLRLGRIDFTYSPRIGWDGVAFCEDGTRPADPIWEYWDQHDTELTEQNPVIPEDGVETSISGGGRLFFFTVGRVDVLPVQPDRWLVLDLTPVPGYDPAPFEDENGEGLDIDGEVYPGTFNAPPIDTDPFIDNVKGTIALGQMFKKGATRQALDLTIRVRTTEDGGWPPAGWLLHSVEDLYIIEDPDDKNVRTLTTANPDDPSGDSDADIFELWQEGVVVGVYRIPLTWTIRMVP